MKEHMTKKTKRFYTPVDRLVRGIALLLVAVSLFGIFRVYGNAQKAADSLTLSERASLSSKIDIEEENFENNIVEKKARSLYGTLRTSDGEVLVDLTHSNTNTPALGSLLGTLNSIDVSDTRYFLNNYKQSIFPHVSWNAVNGFTSPDGTVTLTIDSRVQNSIYQKMVDLGIYGSVTLYDFKTGEIKALCSTPGLGEKNAAGEAAEGSFINKCLYRTSPGSTQKILTLFLAESQGINVANTKFSCNGAYTLQDGTVVRCSGVHGQLINGETAVGKSCNVFFAQLIEKLSVNQTYEQLYDMGWTVNGLSKDGENVFQIGNLPIDRSSLTWTSNNTFVSVWSLIGQCEAMASPLQMVELAGNCATGGNAAVPRLTTHEAITKSGYGAYAEAFQRAWSVWTAGFQQCYSTKDYGVCTAAKTGTSDQLAGETHKLLLAVIGDYSVYIVIENYLQSRVMPYQLLPTIEQSISVIESEVLQ